MPTNPQTNLDFSSYKRGLIEYLKSNPIYKDYSFEGSNLNIILDILAYNAYLQSYYHHAVSGEMFLRTAQREESVRAHAENVGYSIPQARGSEVKLTLVATSPVNGVIRRGSTFAGVNKLGSFTFVLSNDVDLTGSSALGVGGSVDVSAIQGEYKSVAFSESSLSYFPNYFVLPDFNVDISSIEVMSKRGLVTSLLLRSATFIDAFSRNAIPHSTDTNNFFWVRVNRDGRAAIVIGNSADISSGAVASSSVAADQYIATYIKTNGSDGGECTNFSVDNLIIDGSGDFSILDPLVVSSRGSYEENIEESKRKIPLSFQTQNRAVTPSDYKHLLLEKFSGQISDISVYSGVNLEPPRVGHVAISAVDSSGLAPRREVISKILDEAVALNAFVVPIFVEPNVLNLSVDVNVSYAHNTTTVYPAMIASLVEDGVTRYLSGAINRFSSVVFKSDITKVATSASKFVLGADVEFTLSSTKSTAHLGSVLTHNFENPISRIKSTPFMLQKDSTLCVLKSREGGGGLVDIVGYEFGNLILPGVAVVDYHGGKLTQNRVDIPFLPNQKIKIMATPTDYFVKTSDSTALFAGAVGVKYTKSFSFSSNK
jgi:hypothetical protein